MRTRRFAVVLSLLLAIPSAAAAVTYDLVADWSDTSNPNGPWFYLEGPLALPHVDAWQSASGNWDLPQPAWANAENGASSFPAWFKSNGTELFTHDWLDGDVVGRTGDDPDGAPNGPARLQWCSPECGNATITGGVWLGRDSGRDVLWSLWIDGVPVTDGTLHSGDAYDRSNPFSLQNGSGGSGPLTNVSVFPGTLIVLVLTPAPWTSGGEFVGVDMTVDLTMCTPVEPSTWGAIKSLYRN